MKNEDIIRSVMCILEYAEEKTSIEQPTLLKIRDVIGIIA